MSKRESPFDLVCLLGATGAGKTRASLSAARRFAGAVINFDSRQVYRQFPIVTAQPTDEEQQQCPHFLYGFLDCDERLDAGTFAQSAARTIEHVAEQGLLPILVGGTGLYLRILLEGVAPIPPIDQSIRDEVRKMCREQGSPGIHKRLKEIDPEYAEVIHPNDEQRVTRALEVYRGTGHPFSWWHKQRQSFGSFRPLKIGLSVDIDALTPCLKQRIDVMIHQGAVEEVRQALKVCPDTSAPAWSGIGCKELLQYVLGEISLREAKDAWLKSTRAYAKRQLTWFKKEKSIIWINAEDGEQLEKAIRNFLDQ